MNTLAIINARIVDPASRLDSVGDVYVSQGHIAALGAAPAGFVADQTIDAEGLVLAPGLVDLSVRLPSAHELRAAAAGGVTTLVCPPDGTPTLDEPDSVDRLLHQAKVAKLAQVLPLGALTVALAGSKIAEMAELTAAGCVGFYQGLRPITDTRVLLNALRYAATYGYTVWLTPQEPWLTHDAVAHEGEMATRLGLAAIPAAAEAIALAQYIKLVELTGCRIHVARVYTAEAVRLVMEAKVRQLPITADVAIHHLHQCDRDMGYFDSACRVDPPFAGPSDRDALAIAAANGTIDAVCSDHTPHGADAKLVPFAESAPGVTAVELLLPLALMWGRARQLTLAETLTAITHRPAQLLGREARIAAGSVADLVLFDPDANWRVSESTLVSDGKSTPFFGHELMGRVTHTMVHGQVVFGDCRRGDHT